MPPREIVFDPKAAGLLVKAAREAAGLSRNKLASLTGLSRWTIHNVEAGANRPGVFTYVKLANALGLSVADVLGWISAGTPRKEGVGNE